jgi:hypothetical protein
MIKDSIEKIKSKLHKDFAINFALTFIIILIAALLFNMDKELCTHKMEVWYIFFVFNHVLKLILSIFKAVKIQKDEPKTLDQVENYVLKYERIEKLDFKIINLMYLVTMIVGNILSS